MNVHIHSFQPGGAVADEERSSSSRNNGRPIRSWSIPTLSHKEVGRILHDTLKAIAEPFAFLDIACGDAGQMKKALAGTKVDHYHGIDLSEPALELAANNLEGVPFVVELDHRDFVEAIERRPEPADAAWCGLSIHHLSTDSKLELLKAIHGSTGNILLIYEPTLADDEDREG